MKTVLENPADQLSTIIIILFQVAGDTRITSKEVRDEIFIVAHKLHGYSMALAQKQFTDNTEVYENAMAEISGVNKGLKQAKDDIEEIVKVTQNMGRLVSSVEKILISVGSAMA